MDSWVSNVSNGVLSSVPQWEDFQIHSFLAHIMKYNSENLHYVNLVMKQHSEQPSITGCKL